MIMDRKFSLILLLVFTAVVIGGCQTLGIKPANTDPVAMQHPPSSLQEDRLMDVWIALFESGPALTEKDLALGITPEIRKAETRFIPVHLKKTLQQSGYWGAVRVVPQGIQGGELLVTGKILRSDGEILNLEIEAVDSSGRKWLQKEYIAVVGSGGYQGVSEGKVDAFQGLYNAIANDLARLKENMSQAQLREIRTIADMRFAAGMAPLTFDGYLQKDEGRYRIRRLPARDDPMMQRVALIRERDYLFIDTLNDYYDGFYRDAWEPYGDWRRYRSEEAENLRRVEQEAMTRKVLGIGAVVSAVALSMAGSRDIRANTDTLRQLMLIGGVMVAKSGFDKDKEKQIHIDSLAELGNSFDAEISPMVVEVDGDTHRLTGSAEAQYSKWRGLLRKIHRSENALPDISVPRRESGGDVAPTDTAG